VVSHHRIIQHTAEDALMSMVGMLAVASALVSLIQVLANLHEYRQPVVAVAVWLAMFPAAIWLVPRIRTYHLGPGEEVAAIMIAITAVAIIGWDRRTHYGSEQIDLAVLGVGWLLALLALTSRARVWIPAALAVFAVHAALLIHAMGASKVSLTQLEAPGYVTATILIGFTALRSTVAMHARMSAHRARLASSSLAEQAAAAAVFQDRQERLALLEAEALPLLRAIADGTLTPAADDVRERCAQHAAALRHSLTDQTLRADGLLSGLEPALKAASARGLLVDVQRIGDPGVPPRVVVQAVAATVRSVFDALPPSQVLLTIVTSGEDVELYVTFDEPLREPPDVALFGHEVPGEARWHATFAGEETGAGYLRISWRKAVLLDQVH
jgi:hypothetical protein